MAGFNFNISGAPVAKMYKSLKPWGIYDVTFDGFGTREFAGKKDPSATFKVIDFKFSSDEGNFTLTKFWPRDEDAERREIPAANGGKRYQASNFEELMEAIKQAVYVLNPKGFEKLQEASKKFKSFDDVVKAVDVLLKKCVGQKTQIKLTGYINKDGKPVTQIPSLLFVNTETGEASTSNYWIGSKLFFTDYEETQKAKFEGVKPSNPEKPVVEEVTTESNDDAVDWTELDGIGEL